MVSASEVVPAGYKQTAVGLFPKQWKVSCVGEHAEVQTGPFGAQLHASDYRPWGTPLILIRNMKSGQLDDSDIPRISEEDVQRLSRYIVQTGDLIFSRVGRVGSCVVIGSRQQGWLISGQILRVRFDQEKVNPFYAALFFGRKETQSFIQKETLGTTRASINTSILNSLPIVLPKLNEQNLIVEMIRDVESQIDSLSTLIRKKQDIKQGTMEELLTGKTRLPGYSGKWIKTTLGEVCASITDGTHYTPKYVEFGIPFYSVENVTQKNFEDTKFITEKEHLKLIHRCKPERGDILLTRIGSLGKTKLIDWDVDASIYVSLALLKPKPEIYSDFLYVYTQSRQFVIDLENRSLLNASPKKINMNEINEIPIQMPPTEKEQVAISTIILDMGAEITALEQRLEKTKAIKQGMMQQLLTGKIRLVEPQTTLEDAQ